VDRGQVRARPAEVKERQLGPQIAEPTLEDAYLLLLERAGARERAGA
jgi:hypothetical protein